MILSTRSLLRCKKTFGYGDAIYFSFPFMAIINSKPSLWMTFTGTVTLYDNVFFSLRPMMMDSLGHLAPQDLCVRWHPDKNLHQTALAWKLRQENR